MSTTRTPDHDAFLLSGPGGPHDDGDPWNVPLIEEAYEAVDNQQDRIKHAGMMSSDLQAKFTELLTLLAQDIEGFTDANKG